MLTTHLRVCDKCVTASEGNVYELKRLWDLDKANSSLLWTHVQKTPMKIVEEEEEEVAEIQPDPLHQLILHFSHNALTERRYTSF